MGRLGVKMVRRDDRYRLDAVGARGLLPCHAGEVGIGAGKAERRGRAGRPLRSGGQSTRHKLVTVVEPRRDAVHGAEKAPSPPPTMPSRMRRPSCLDVMILFRLRFGSVQTQHAAVPRLIWRRLGEVVQGALRRRDHVGRDESCAFARAILRVAGRFWVSERSPHAAPCAVTCNRPFHFAFPQWPGASTLALVINVGSVRAFSGTGRSSKCATIASKIAPPMA